MRHICIYLLILISAFSCKKERIKKNHKEFIGFWIHHLNATDKTALEIEPSGGGTVFYTWDHNLSDDDESGNWFIKDENLIFCHFYCNKPYFKIDQYPIKADSAFIVDYDTILKGNRFIILDGIYYQDYN